MSLEKLAESELERREKRNLRDRLARSFLRNHPKLIEDPKGDILDAIPEGTTEAAVRSVARHYRRMKLVRDYIRSTDGLAETDKEMG